VQPGARRIDHAHARRTEALARELGAIERAREVAGHETRLLEAVGARVGARILDRRFAELEANNARARRRQGQREQPAAAAQIEDELARREARARAHELDQALGLRAIGLEERVGRDREDQPGHALADRARAMQHALLGARGDLRHARVHLLHQGRDLGVAADEAARVGLDALGRGRARHEQNQDLARGAALAQHEVTQQAGVRREVPGRQVELARELARAGHDGRGLAEGDRAGDHVEHLVVASGHVQTEREARVGAGRLAALDPAPRAKGELHLVTVMPGIGAGHDRREPGPVRRREQGREEPREPRVARLELGRVG
jgi:hypothetical protein